MFIVSVIIPTYNREKYIQQAVNCVLNQTFKDFEIIVVDDGSTDKTKQVIEQLILQAPNKIKYIYQVNQGAAAARNRGIKEAAGKYIAFLDSDDEWDQQFLEKVMAEFKNEDCDWVATGAYRVEINELGQEINRTLLKKGCLGVAVPNFLNISLFEALLNGNIIGETSRVVIKKFILDEIGGFRIDLRLSEDYELWLRIAQKKYKISFLEEPLMIYKKRGDSLTSLNKNILAKYSYKILKIHAQEAFNYGVKYKKLWADLMWDLARDVYYSSPRDYFLFLKCAGQSLFYDLSPKRINRLFKIKKEN